jgi:hypothetical protein
MVSCLSWYEGRVEVDSVRRLLLELRPDMPKGRTVLYISYDCEPPWVNHGDYANCDVVSAIIERESDTVVWREFAYIQARNARPRRQPVVLELGPYRFAWSVYEAELKAALETSWKGNRLWTSPWNT